MKTYAFVFACIPMWKGLKRAVSYPRPFNVTKLKLTILIPRVLLQVFISIQLSLRDRQQF